MNNNSIHTDKLISYLDGELSLSEKEALQAELENNTDMQQELGNLISAKSAIKHYGLAQKVNDIHQTMMQERTAQKNTSKAVVRSLPKMIMRIAASIILLVGLFGLYQYVTVSPNNLYNGQYTAYEVATMRGTTDINALEKAYGEKKYDDVISLYKQTAKPTVKEQFLAAQAYLIKEDYINAIELFNGVIETNKAVNTSTLNDDAEYYLALSYLKNKETSKALVLFNKIHENKDHLYHNKVSSWYLAKVNLLNWKN